MWRGLVALARGIDRLSDAIGRAAGWLALAMVALGAYNAVARYTDRFTGWRLSSNAYLEAQWYLFSLLFLLAGAYALRHGRHVRVDVLYGRLGRRARAWIDLAGSIVFLLPFSLFALWVSWPAVRNSWAVREVSSDPGGLPRYPIKAVILVAFALLVLQGIAEIVKNAARLRGEEIDAGDGDEQRGMT
ncbi:MAG: TRAP transporter small permease subunit [Acidobacteria bacterium]|nr:MAG: TRAP transporter small permease subunit [Acidobacteriota bacterium]